MREVNIRKKLKVVTYRSSKHHDEIQNESIDALRETLISSNNVSTDISSE